MTKESDYTFGYLDAYCDAPNCDAHEQLDGMDNFPPSYADANSELFDLGWRTRKIGGEWKDFCPEHSGAV